MAKIRRYTKEEDEFIINNLDKKNSWIAKQLGRSDGSIINRKTTLGLHQPKPRKRVPQPIIADVLELRKEGYSIREVAQRLGTGEYHVRKAIEYLEAKGELPKKCVNKLDLNEMPVGEGKLADHMIYAIMKGERTIAEGNLKELVEQLGIKEESVRFMLSPTHLKRAQGTNQRYAVFLYDEREFEQ